MVTVNTDYLIVLNPPEARLYDLLVRMDPDIRGEWLRQRWPVEPNVSTTKVLLSLDGVPAHECMLNQVPSVDGDVECLVCRRLVG